MLETMRKWVRSLEANPAICIFPLCGSAWYEWQVFQYVCDVSGSTKPNIVLMDAQISPSWPPIWQRLADEHSVQITVLDSYITLDSFVQGLPTETRAIVPYINGYSNFAEPYCKSAEHSLLCKQAAISFWKWCAKHAVHPPVMFDKGMQHKKANKDSWDQVAEYEEYWLQLGK